MIYNIEVMELEVFYENKKNLNLAKHELDKISGKWEDIKHDINPSEYVFTFEKGKSVSAHTPVSRAFFKMVEIIHTIRKTCKDVFPCFPIRTLHLAESPGGFIEAWNWMRRTEAITDYSSGYSLDKHDVWKKFKEKIHSWSRKPELNIGDLLDGETRGDIISDYYSEKAFLVTGDGGFNFTEDYEKIEETVFPLILSQFVVGISCLEKGGVYIQKIFDCTMLHTIQLIWVCENIFEKVTLFKPETSRVCNAEKYLIGIGLKPKGEQLLKFLKWAEDALSKKVKIKSLFPSGPGSSWDNMNPRFQEKYIVLINSLLKKQTAWIHRGLRGDVISSSTKIKTAVEWCRRHRIPINSTYFDIHSLFNWREETSSQESHRLSSLRRRTTSLSPLPCD